MAISVKLNPTDKKLKVGDILEIPFTISGNSPEDQFTATVRSSSEETATAEVTENASIIVNALKKGNVTIMLSVAKADDANVTANTSVQLIVEEVENENKNEEKPAGPQPRTPASEDTDPDFSNFEIVEVIYAGTKNVKGPINKKYKINFGEGTYDSIHYFSDDIAIAKVDNNQGCIILLSTGTTTVWANATKGKETTKIKIPVHALPENKEIKMVYTKKEMKKFLENHMAIEKGFCHSLKDDVIVCQLDVKSDEGKELMKRGLKEVKLEIDDVSPSRIILKTTVLSDRGPIDPDTGKRGVASPVETRRIYTFTNGTLPKTEVVRMYRKFQEDYSAGFTK